jgi:hypothetical protein
VNGEIQLWHAGKNIAAFPPESFMHLPRIGEHVGFADREAKVTAIVHYTGREQLNKPHIRLYVKVVK